MTSQGDILADLECGGCTSDEETRELISSSNKGNKQLYRCLRGALSYNGSVSSDSDPESSDSFSKSGSGIGRRVEVFISRKSGCDERWNLLTLLNFSKKLNLKKASKLNLKSRSIHQQETIYKKNFSKKLNLKKASKLPRPPKGPSLNASDIKMVRELIELAARKRARSERVRSIRKMKDTKRESSSSSMVAFVITIVFFLVFFQGNCGLRF